VSLKLGNRVMGGLLLFSLLCGGALAAVVEESDYRKVYLSQGSFEDIRTDLEYEVTGRGIVINNVSHIGDMLERTGKDIGASLKVYEQAEAIEFCSASASRVMMEADRHNIVYCPYIISIYTLPGEADRVYLSYRRLQGDGSDASSRALAAVEALLDDIIQQVIR
jgi:uncharacterized protein (DUF302 family)